MAVRFGPAGLGDDGEHAVVEFAKAGLTAAEVEFTHGVRMSVPHAQRIGEAAKKAGITLSVHAPYFLNLASDEPEKVEATKKRIIASLERAHHLGAKFVVFHPAYYGKRPKEEVYALVKKALLEMETVRKKNKWTPILAPETTGRVAQFGTLEELLRLAKETGCGICVDFAHLKARYQGDIDYKKVFAQLKNPPPITAHFSGIEWGKGGERRHILTDEKLIEELLKHIIASGTDLTIINESPDPVGDSMKMLKIYTRLTRA